MRGPTPLGVSLNSRMAWSAGQMVPSMLSSAGEVAHLFLSNRVVELAADEVAALDSGAGVDHLGRPQAAV